MEDLNAALVVDAVVRVLIQHNHDFDTQALFDKYTDNPVACATAMSRPDVRAEYLELLAETYPDQNLPIDNLV